MKNKITAPTVVSQYDNEIDEVLSEDHKVVEHKKCPVCHGSKLDIELGGPCEYCKSTGIAYTVTYGVENKKPFVVVEDNTVEYIIEYCMLRRMHEESYKERVAAGIKEIYKLPHIIRLDLMSKDYPMLEMEEKKDVRGIFRALRKEYGDTFLLTNLII